MANKDFKDYAIAGSNVTLTYDDINDTVTFSAQGNVQSVNAKTGVVVINKTDVGLSAVDNTSDINKPISSATQTALNAKQDTLISATNIKTINSNSVLGSGDVLIDKTSIGLSNVANIDTTNASNISSGSLNDARLSANVTTQGNTFNAASKLVQLDATAKLPAVDGSQLTNLPTFSAPNGLLRLGSAISTTLQTVTDYLNNVSVLQLNSRRIGILSDSSVATQTSSVIQSSTTNANLVIAPNGTGALVANIPDSVTGGGNARGVRAVDLQMIRVAPTQVASGVNTVICGGNQNTVSGDYGFVGGGSQNNTTGGYSVISGGLTNAINYFAATASTISGGATNTVSERYATIAGGQSNTVSSQYSVVSGGQSNTASTGTHSTVVGGLSNTASGQYSVAGGNNSTASGARSLVLGDTCQSTVTWGVALGRNNTVTGGDSGVALGYGSNVTSYSGMAICGGGKSYIDTQLAQGGSSFSVSGDNQASIIVTRNGTFSGSRLDFTTGQTALIYAGNSVSGLIIPNGSNRAWNVQINTIAVVTTITGTATGVTVGDTYSEVKNLLFKRIGGTSSIVGTVDTSNIKSNTSMATALLSITAGASQEMAITFTAPTFVGGGSVTCRVVSKVSLVEVAY